nr:endolytic transglycosylase MltG [Mycobacterium sp. QGD 101]
MLALVTVAGVYLGSRLWHEVLAAADDFVATEGHDIIVEVHEGDSTVAIAETLADREVVVTAGAFVEAAGENQAISAIQPGFYRLHTFISASEAVERLADPRNRTGRVVIPEGRQLDDVQDVKTGAVTEGILTLVSRATCVVLDGDERCVDGAALRQAAASVDLATLKVPDWAVASAEALRGDHRRIEGLIAAGAWNVDPIAAPADIVASLITASVNRYTAAGLGSTAAGAELATYQVLIVASLVQREAAAADFAKVARVIINRLTAGQNLELDSTVNYVLQQQEVATTDADRAESTPWNTYAAPGLPATPICSPSAEAIAAAARPAEGDWMYFVTVDRQGTTVFTSDYQQHLVNVELARANGVLDSAR